MSSNTIRHLKNYHKGIQENKQMKTPRTMSKTLYVNKYNHLSVELDELTKSAVTLRDTYEKKLTTLEEETERLNLCLDELVQMNSDLINIDNISNEITEKLKIYVIDENDNLIE